MEEDEEEDEATTIARLSGEGVAKSLKCSDCGKAFRSTVSPVALAVIAF
jgi:hypothetical protein